MGECDAAQTSGGAARSPSGGEREGHPGQGGRCARFPAGGEAPPTRVEPQLTPALPPRQCARLPRGDGTRPQEGVFTGREASPASHTGGIQHHRQSGPQSGEAVHARGSAGVGMDPALAALPSPFLPGSPSQTWWKPEAHRCTPTLPPTPRPASQPEKGVTCQAQGGAGWAETASLRGHRCVETGGSTWETPRQGPQP